MNKTTVTRQLYTYGNQKLQYTLVKSKRRKTSEIVVDEDEVVIRIPTTKSTSDVENLLNNKIHWILKRQRELGEKVPDIIKPEFVTGTRVPYLGNNYELQVTNDGKTNNKVRIKNKKIIISVNSIKFFKSDFKSQLKSIYDDWLYEQAKKIFEEKINKLSIVIGVRPKRIIVKKLKNRWGSLTKEGTINLNYNLVKAPDPIIDYIIIHELCHLIIKKHSHHYWNLLKGYVTDYKEKIDWLEINGKNLVC